MNDIQYYIPCHLSPSNHLNQNIFFLSFSKRLSKHDLNELSALAYLVNIGMKEDVSTEIGNTMECNCTVMSVLNLNRVFICRYPP